MFDPFANPNLALTDSQVATESPVPIAMIGCSAPVPGDATFGPFGLLVSILGQCDGDCRPRHCVRAAAAISLGEMITPSDHGVMTSG